MKIVYRFLLALHIFVGIGAVAGGSAAIFNPMSPLGMPIEPLKNSPFSNYLIPGIILFTIIGLGNLFCALMFRFKTKFQAYISGTVSGALVVWIVVQCIMLKVVAFLHILFFTIGLIEGMLALAILFEQRLFPVNLVLAVFGKNRNKK